MTGIFISYRRDETAAYAGRLRDRLVSEFGLDQVFMDVDTIELGADFTVAIENAISDVSVFLCVMGPGWATLKDENGVQRLHAPLDFVNLEVSNALKRKIRVVPVLVKGARMPSKKELPDNLKELVKRNALELGDARFHSDIDLLIKSLRKILDEPGGNINDYPGKSVDEGTISLGRRFGFWVVATLIACLLGGGAWYYWNEYKTDQQMASQKLEAQTEQLKLEAEEAKLKTEAEAKAQQAIDAEKAKLQAELVEQRRIAVLEKIKREKELVAREKAEAEKAKLQTEIEAQRITDAEKARRETIIAAQKKAEAEKARKKAEIKAKREAALEARRKAETERLLREKNEAIRGEKLYTTIQKLYTGSKTSNSCSQLKDIIKSMGKYSKYTYPVPQDKIYSVRYPKQISTPTISNLITDRSIRIRMGKKECFKLIIKNSIPSRPIQIEVIKGR